LQKCVFLFNLLKVFFSRGAKKKIRAGFAGHLTKLANNFYKLSEKDDDIKAELAGNIYLFCKLFNFS